MNAARKLARGAVRPTGNAGSPRLGFWAIAVVAPLAVGSFVGAADKADDVFRTDVVPALEQYCGDCHSGDAAEGEFDYTAYASLADVRTGRARWLKVLAQLKTGTMPPEDMEQPTAQQREMLIQWIDDAVNRVDCSRPVSPGRVTLRRLNRNEYRYTIRDLLGIDYRPARDFPADDVGYGFDNIGDVLSLPPLLMEKYLAAADEISQEALNGAHRDRILTVRPGGDVSPGEAARKVLTPLASRAFRRPVKPAEVDRLLRLVQLAERQGDSWQVGVQLALQAILVSPHFLYRVELDPRGEASQRTLNDFELATRLSYFLWNSMPDRELFQLAEAGRLRHKENLESQVRRMLRDPKCQRFIRSFGSQWLQLRNLEDITFDRKSFPDCDSELLADMRKETELFLESMVREDRSILDILEADFTFVNERLARHYGVPGVQGEPFRRVSLTGTHRAGVLTQASVLSVTSNPTRTSPVKRGKFVLDNILGTPPPPPPSDVPLLEDAGRKLTGTLRERLEQHRTDPSCAACHKLMDPLGFAFENFDAIGRWRAEESGEPIDASGEFPDGASFTGPADFRQVLLQTRRDAFVRCFTEKLLTYALGRGLEYYDKCAVDTIVNKLEQDDYRFSRLVLEIARSHPFQKRARKRG